MKDELKTLFGQITPAWSDEEMLSAVLGRKAENMTKRKKVKKAAVILAAAAVVLGSTAVGVSAAVNKSLPELFQEIFLGSDNSYRETAQPYFDFTGIGKPLDKTIEFDFGRIEVLGIAADEHTAFLLYDVVFDEDFDYEGWEVEMFCEEEPTLKTMFKSGGYGSSANWEVLGREGNVLHQYCTFSISNTTLRGYDLKFTIENARVFADGEIVEKCPINKSFTVSPNFDKMQNALCFDVNEPISLDGTAAVLESVELSTFGAEFCFRPTELSSDEVEAIEKANYEERADFVCTLADGGSIDAKYSGSHVQTKAAARGEDEELTETRISVYYSWSYPVRVGEISRVQIGDYELSELN